MRIKLTFRTNKYIFNSWLNYTDRRKKIHDFLMNLRETRFNLFVLQNS
ncbi:hypothetical protein HMPREF0868_1103 [Mageeibacillus indolicus UPII9-5]|uniref:Uncharacterized protein n=1 Tax=Mageeibacillus indolicus (strain UPII9-5) TaxID=699246 RepID=D3R2I3_MAGIU|nr:hypothetical protein HMPREF0868_1103 [Mageeibacillus indolicus UPII9-5]